MPKRGMSSCNLQFRMATSSPPPGRDCDLGSCRARMLQFCVCIWKGTKFGSRTSDDLSSAEWTQRAPCSQASRKRREVKFFQRFSVLELTENTFRTLSEFLCSEPDFHPLGRQEDVVGPYVFAALLILPYSGRKLAPRAGEGKSESWQLKDANLMNRNGVSTSSPFRPILLAMSPRRLSNLRMPHLAIAIIQKGRPLCRAHTTLQCTRCN